MNTEHLKFSYCYILKWKWKYKMTNLLRDSESVDDVTKCLETTEDKSFVNYLD